MAFTLTKYVSSAYFFKALITKSVFTRQYAKVNSCYTPVCDIQVKRAAVTGEEKCRVRDFLTKYYFPDDPLLKAANLNEVPPDPIILQYYLQFLNEGKTFYCVSSNSTELLGLAICHSLTPMTAKHIRSYAERVRREDAKRYLEFLAMVEERANLYKNMSVQRILQVDVVCTRSLYRRRGICKQLLKACREMSESEGGYGLLRFNTGNMYAGRAAQVLPRTQVVSRKDLETYKDPKGIPWLKKNLCLPHRNIEVYVSDLRKKK